MIGRGLAMDLEHAFDDVKEGGRAGKGTLIKERL